MQQIKFLYYHQSMKTLVRKQTEHFFCGLVRTGLDQMVPSRPLDKTDGPNPEVRTGTGPNFTQVYCLSQLVLL